VESCHKLSELFKKAKSDSSSTNSKLVSAGHEHVIEPLLLDDGSESISDWNIKGTKRSLKRKTWSHFTQKGTKWNTSGCITATPI